MAALPAPALACERAAVRVHVTRPQHGPPLGCEDVEENRCSGDVGNRPVLLSDDDRRALAARAYRVGRRTLRDIATIVAPDTLLRWHRQLIAGKWTLNLERGRRGELPYLRANSISFTMRLGP